MSTVERETATYKVMGDDDTCLIVKQYSYRRTQDTGSGRRTYPGSRRLALLSGEAVRYIDSLTFEVIATGEMLRRCD